MRRHPDIVIRLIALFKLVKALLLICVGLGALSMRHDDSWVTTWIHAFAADPHGRRVSELIARVTSLDAHALVKIGVGTLIYATIYIVEGIGLMLRRAWAEIMTVIVTTSFIPLECYELSHHWSWAKVLVIIVNVGVVLYLLRRLKRENHWPFRRE
jgi:uncharacterized membrane protein (DUF2068 family)